MCRFIKCAAVLAFAALPAFAQAPEQRSPIERALNTALSDAIGDKIRLLAQVATLQDQIAALQKQIAEQPKPTAEK
jgi:hypothetical protein